MNEKSTAGDLLARIKTLYYKTSRATIDRDFDLAVDLLKALPQEERPRATVYMEGLAEMRKEFKRGKGARRDSG